MAQSNSLQVSILGIFGGSLLLLVNSYASSLEKNFIPHTALGILLLIFSALVAYTGVCHSLSHAQLFSTLCLTVSALWCGSGLIHILVGQGVLQLLELKSSLVPGLAAFTLALFIIGCVALFGKKPVLFLIAVGISLACAHQIAGLFAVGFGQSATAANYLLVCLVCVYFGFGCLLSMITQGKVRPPGVSLKQKAELKTEQKQGCTKAESVGLVMNLLSASVLACPLLEVVPKLFVGHVPWLWTAGVFQLGMCVLLYRAMDTLAATFYGFTALLKFAEGYSALLSLYAIQPYSPVPFPVVFAVLFSVLALFSCQKSLLEGIYQLFFVAYCISIAAQSSGFYQGGTQGVQGAIFIATALMLFITAFNMVSSSLIPTGRGVFKTVVTRMQKVTLRSLDKEQHVPHLGYSKYADAEVLGHACNVLASFAITATVGNRDPLSVLVLPWVVMAGGVLQLLCGSVAFARGKTFESTVFIFYGVMWTVWGLTRYGGLYGETRGFNVAVGIISFMLFDLLVTVAALFLNVAWFIYAFTFQLILISFLLDAVDSLPYGYDIGVTIIFGLISFYCFLAYLFNNTFESPQIPLGRPVVRLGGVGGGADVCPHVPARKATSVQQIAEIMKNGGICGMPTDTVYVLVAACNRPDAVVKAYKVKKQAEDRPMSMWISSIKQLEPVRHLLSPLLLDFMEAAWPSSISMVIPRGPWMDIFGLGDAAKHIGTPQSIAIRNPDCAVATHLINLVGPIAVTSANPTGEADTTHHNQVYAKLGKKVDGVLCDGPSPENIASTVVDCTKIETGQLGFFRVGLIPKSKVLDIFEEVQNRHKRGQTNVGFDYDQHLSELEPELHPGVYDTTDSGRGSEKQSLSDRKCQKQRETNLGFNYNRHEAEMKIYINPGVYETIDAKRGSGNQTSSGVSSKQHCHKQRQTNPNIDYDLHLPEIELEINPGVYETIDAERTSENQTFSGVSTKQHCHKQRQTNPNIDYDLHPPKKELEINPGVFETTDSEKGSENQTGSSVSSEQNRQKQTKTNSKVKYDQHLSEIEQEMIPRRFETMDLPKGNGTQSPSNVSSKQNHHKQRKTDPNLEYDRHLLIIENKINARMYHTIDSKRGSGNQTASGASSKRNSLKQGQTNPGFSYDQHLPEIELEINQGACDTIDAEGGSGNQTPSSVSSDRNHHKSGWANPTFDYDRQLPEIELEINSGAYDT